MLLAPSFFDGRLDGIGRVSGVFERVLSRVQGAPTFVASSNDPAGACPAERGRCFARNYRAMLLWGLIGRLPRTKPPLLVSTHLGLSPVARLVARRWKVPYTVFIHGVEAWKDLPGRSHWGLAKAAHLFTNSDYTWRRFLEFHPRYAAFPHTTVHLGVPVADLASGPPPTRPPGPGTKVLVVGRMSKADYYAAYRQSDDLYKGFHLVVNAITRLQDAVPGIQLTLVGDGDARADLEAWALQQPCASRLRFLGRVSDAELQRQFRDADVFVLPSEGEGFGLVFAEAMAHGLPCVCVDAGAAPEVVQDGRTGLVAQPRNLDDLAAKMQTLLTDGVLRTRLGSQAHERYRTYFAVEHFEARVEKALRSVVKPPPVAG